MAICNTDKICAMVVACIQNRFSDGIATNFQGDGSAGDEWRWDAKFDNNTIKVNGNNELYVDFTGIDTDTILNNPHFGAGAPVGFSRLYYDLYNKLTNTAITADYTFVDIPELDGICEIQKVGTDFSLRDSFYDQITPILSANIEGKVDQTGSGILPNRGDNSKVIEALIVRENCKLKVYIPAEHTVIRDFDLMYDSNNYILTVGVPITLYSAILSFSNISTARDVALLYKIGYQMKVFGLNGMNDITFTFQYSRDGGAWTGIKVIDFRQMATGTEYWSLDETLLDYSQIISAGTSGTLQSRIIVTGNGVSGQAAIFSTTISQGIYGVTM